MTIEQERTRVLAWEDCNNVRDLGGYPTRSGKTTRWGVYVRADNLSRLTPDGQKALAEYGIKTIIDLRMQHEVAAFPNPFAEPGPHDVSYRNISFVDLSGASSENFTTLANDYKGMLDRFAPSVVEILQAIANVPEGGVLFHCMGGKDRTGLTAALILELAGVPRDVIAEDYALTEQCLGPSDREWIENGPGERAERERLYQLYMPRAEVMAEVLEYLDERYGSPEEYLLQAGLSAEDIERLRRRLADEAD